jgi:quercetin dioxygenase-like cupin family protein
MALADTMQPRHLGAREGHQRRVITDLVTTKAAATDTGEVYSLFELETPASGGCPPHAQRYDDEAFYVLDGTYAFLIGEEEIELRSGGYAFAPRGTVHGFVNVGSPTARMLVLVTPGGIQESFFLEVGDRADRPAWEPDMAKVLAVVPKYGIQFSPSGEQEEGDSPG